jgi:hypothetical protein
MTMLIRTMLCLALATGALACRPAAPGTGFEQPMCVAQDTNGQEVTCTAPDRSFDGDPCTCVDSVTKSAAFGRVKGGL